MTAFAIVKKTAKTALRDNWIKAIFLCLTIIFASLTIYIIDILVDVVLPNGLTVVINSLFTMFLVLPLCLGVLRAFWRIAFADTKDTLTEAFCYFSSITLYKRAMTLIFGLFLKALGIGIVLFIPAIAASVFSSVEFYEMLGMSAPAFASNLWILSAFLTAAALIVLCAVMLKYYLAPFLFIADEQMDAAEAIHKSTLLSRATASDFLLFFLSFIGWFLLSVLIVPLVFTLPYFIMSYIVYSRFAVANYNKVTKQFKVKEDFQFSADNIEL